MPEASPSRRLGPGLAVVAAVVALVGGLGPGLDAQGRIVCGVVAVLLAAGAVLSRTMTPTLRVEYDDLLVRDGLRLRRVPRSDIRQVRSDRGRRSRGLEIDLGEELVVVPAYLLGEVDLGGLAAELDQWLRAPRTTRAPD